MSKKQMLGQYKRAPEKTAKKMLRNIGYVQKDYLKVRLPAISDIPTLYSGNCLSFNKDAKTYEELYTSTSMLYTPIADRVECIFEDKDTVTTAKIQVNGKHITLNMIIGNQGSRRLKANFIIPSLDVHFTDLSKCYQRKSSDFHTAAIKLFKLAELMGDKQRTDSLTVNGIPTPMFTNIMIDGCAQYAAELLLALNLMASYMGKLTREYTDNEGYRYIPVEELLWVRASMDAQTQFDEFEASSIGTDFTSSTLMSFDERDKPEDLAVSILGDKTELFSYFATVSPGSHDQLKRVAGVVDVDDVNKASRREFLLIDSKGVQLATCRGNHLQLAIWGVRPTDLHDSQGNELFAMFYKRSDKWYGYYLQTATEFYETNFPDCVVQDFKFHATETYGLAPFHYDCADDILSDLATDASLRSVADVSFFLRMLIWRARNEGVGRSKPINTGLISTDNQFLYVKFHNLFGNIDDVAVEYLGTNAGEPSNPLLFYSRPGHLLMRTDQDITISGRGITHLAVENKDRLGDGVLALSENELFSAVQKSLAIAKKHLQVNPFYAQPFYSHKTNYINHFLPMYLKEGGEPVAGMLVSNYCVRTIYSLDWVRQRGSCLGIPLAAWL